MYFLPALITALLFLWIGLFVFFNNKKAPANVSFFLLCLTTFGWQFTWFLLFAFADKLSISLMIHLGYSFIIFIPITYFHFLVSFLERRSKSVYVAASYVLGVIFLALLWNTNYLIQNFYRFSWGYYPKAGAAHPLYLGFLTLLTLAGIWMLLRDLSKPNKQEQHNQIKYVFIALLFYIPAATDFFVNYGASFYPFGFLFIALSLSTIAYAIVRHNLMNIEVIIRRTAVFAGLFTFVYGVFTVISVLGQDFFRDVLGLGRWASLIPTVLIITFSLRPLENFLTEITEKYLFQKKYDYRQLLKTFTNEVLTVLDIQQLPAQTVAGLIRILKLESVAILLHDKERKLYSLAAEIGSKDSNLILPEDHTLISYLKATNQHILKDKVADKIEGDGEMKSAFKALNAQVCFPISMHDDLIGILALGMKKSGEDYTQEDIDILQTLARTEAIAIANAQLFDELSKTQAEAAQREKMAVIGTLAAGINHEICNPLGIVRGQCEMFLLNNRDGFYKNKTQEEVLRLSADIMNKVIKETDRATAITKKLSGFAKPSKRSDLEEVAIGKEVDEVLGLIGHDLKLSNIDVQQDFPSNFPIILADRKQIQEVLFNIIRNAAQAIDKKQGKIVVSGFKDNGTAVVRIADNGSGIPGDKINQIFNPFYTTKAPGKGTGLGLFIVKQVVERNKGVIMVESEVGVGTTFTLRFPTAGALSAAA